MSWRISSQSDDGRHTERRTFERGLAGLDPSGSVLLQALSKVHLTVTAGAAMLVEVEVTASLLTRYLLAPHMLWRSGQAGIVSCSLPCCVLDKL